MKRIVLVLIAGIVFAGCQNKELAVDRDIQDGRKSYTTKYGYTTYVIPVEMDNGAKCVLAMYVSGHGVAISCDWTRANLTTSPKTITCKGDGCADVAAALPGDQGSSGDGGGL